MCHESIQNRIFMESSARNEYIEMNPEQYRNLGFSPFPCKEKKPTRCKTWPNDVPFVGSDQIAIPTPVGSVCIDLDERPGINGVKLFSELAPESWAHTGPKAITGGGGVHLWFKVSPALEIGCSRGSLPIGIDVKGPGGYLIVPPSIHHETGVQYKWVRPMVPVDEMPELPRWILVHLLASEPPHSKPKLSQSASDAASGETDNPAYVRGVLSTACLNVSACPRGDRNNKLFYELVNAAKYLHTGVFDEATMVENLRSAAMQCGLPHREINTTMNSALEHVTGECKTVPPLRDENNHAVNAKQSKFSDDWPEIKKMSPLHPPLPRAGKGLIPLEFREWLLRAADELSVPLVGVVVPAIVAAASVIGRGVTIRPDPYSRWTVTPNLWGAIVASPGLLKTPTMEVGLGPLRPLIEETAARHETKLRELAPRKIKLNAQLKKAKANPSIDEVEISDILERIESCKIPERRYLVQDATLEKLQEIQADNPRGTLLARDELTGWIASLDKVGREGDRSYYLESWNGNGASTIDRIGRGTTRVNANCLSLIGTIQPDKLAPLVVGANDGTSNDGLLQRLQLLVYVDELPIWTRPALYEDDGTLDRIKNLFITLDMGLSEKTPCKCTFSARAQEKFSDWHERLEQRLRHGDLASVGAKGYHLGKYRSLMPSLACVFQLISTAGQILDSTQTKFDHDIVLHCEAFDLARRWCTILELHADRLYSTDSEPDHQGAHVLVTMIANEDIVTGTSVRSIHRDNRKIPLLAIKDGLTVLTTMGWLVVDRVSTGGRPTEIVRLNPKLDTTDLFDENQ